MHTADRRQLYDEHGLNTGTWPEIVADQLITPVARFFTRSHAPPAAVDPGAWRLEVQGLVDRSAAWSLDDLTARFPRRDLEATLVCAGLRRAELLTVAPLPGELPWGPDAASTGRWSGVRLADVLHAAGVSERAGHVEFLGLDRVARGDREFGFAGSIDMQKALSDDVLLATHLNGRPLPPVHGFPLRAVVPGWIGARSVKWLGRITVRAEPSDNYFQTRAYRLQWHVDPTRPGDVSAGTPMSAVPLNAVILEPRPGAAVPAGPVRLRGWAIGSECRPLTAIEVAVDGGSNWVRAETIASGGAWTWTFWEAVVSLAPGSHELSARATDGSGVMPPTVRDTWNVKGYGNNAWYRVTITAR
jgi:sulfite oxidase